MIYEIDGDLLLSDCTTIMHQANCFSTMGAGIARGIAVKHPEVELADRNFPFSPKGRLGKYSYGETKDGKFVVNLYGQFKPARGLQTDYNMLEKSIREAITGSLRGLNDLDLSKLGIPYKMGCGLAGGDWEVVYEIVSRLSFQYNVDIYIYKLEELI